MGLKLVVAFFLAVLWWPAQARTWEHHEHATWKTVSTVSLEHGVTCATVRQAVAVWGLSQARQFALDHGMTPSQEHRARRCLGSE